METRLLKKVPLFSSLKTKELEKLARLSSLQTYGKDNIILMEEDTGSSLFIINKGRVKISRVSRDGKEVILAILKEGDIFGEMSLISGEKRSANVTTIEDSELLVLRRDDFFNLLNGRPETAILLLKELAKRLRIADAQIKSLSLLDAVARVGSAIMQLIETNSVVKDGKVIIEKAPSQQDLANIAGTSRETVSRALNLFIKEGLISKAGNNIIVEKIDKFSHLYT